MKEIYWLKGGKKRTKMMEIENIMTGYERDLVEWIKKHYKELGYDKIIKYHEKNYSPDFIMLRDNKQVGVEVETLSSNFILHKHDPKKVDEVLCIVNNVELPVKTIEIKQLKMWYELKGEDLLYLFKNTSKIQFHHHKKYFSAYHHPEEWENISKEDEVKILRKMRMGIMLSERQYISTSDVYGLNAIRSDEEMDKELKEKVGNIFDTDTSTKPAPVIIEIETTDYCLNCKSHLVYNHLGGYHCLSCKKEGMAEVGRKKWVALDNDVKEALSLYLHLKNHTEVQEAPTYKGMPICKICNKSVYQIMAEEWESLSTFKKEGIRPK